MDRWMAGVELLSGGRSVLLPMSAYCCSSRPHPDLWSERKKIQMQIKELDDDINMTYYLGQRDCQGNFGGAEKSTKIIENLIQH